MRKSMLASAVIAALLVAGVANNQAAQAAPNDCLSAPKGAAPKGQHWYYHLDRAANRKCWYLRDLGAATAAPSQHADRAVPASDNSASATPVNAAAQPAQRAEPAASSAHPAADVSPPPAAATPVDAQAAAPSPSIAAPAAATVWTDPPPASAGDRNVAAATAAPPVAADPPAGRAPARERSAVPRETQATSVSMPRATSGRGLAENLLVILLAAMLAAAAFGVFVVMRRRKRARIGAGVGGPRFGSRAERDDGRWLKWPRRDSEPHAAAPIQSSLIPQQVRMARGSTPHR